MTKGIEVQLVEERTLTLREFLLTGDSFGICRDLHRWPPLPTLGAFLAQGVDDAGERTMHWQPFVTSEEEYAAARAAVDEHGVVDALETASGDWQGWFQTAVVRLEAGA